MCRCETADMVFASMLQVHSLWGPHVIVLRQTSLKNWLQIH